MTGSSISPLDLIRVGLVTAEKPELHSVELAFAPG